ncbi:hypothetical protein DB796_17445, partial [Xanthomonas perforans]
MPGACADRLSGSAPGAAGPGALGRCAVAGRGSSCAGPRTAAAPGAAGAGPGACRPALQPAQRRPAAQAGTGLRAVPGAAGATAVLDEPTHHLDLASVEAIEALL